jgi:hypothetical protein
MKPVPDVIGMEPEEALRAMHEAGIQCEVKMSGPPRGYREGDRSVVVRQRMGPGEKDCELVICQFIKGLR